mgnify:CR=1 FL=1
MSLVSPVLQRLEAYLPLDGLHWDAHAGTLPEAAVLVTLTDESDPQVLLGQRAGHLQHHPGEIAFPGGKREPGDASPWVTAKREALEEVGLPEDQIHPLGELRPMVTRTGFEVHPCVARIPLGLELTVDTREFDSAFYQPLAAFCDERLLQLHVAEVEGRELTVPHYRLDGRDVWGVTAAVLALVASAAYDVQLDLKRDWSQRP